LPDGTLIEYIVDGRNRRVGKKVNGTLQKQWIYDGQLRPVAEMDGSGTLVSQFVYATHINIPDYIIKSGVTYRVITDHLGSLRFVINTSTGSIAQRMDYDDWGNVLVNTNPDFTPFGFAGGIYDSQTKLTRFGARDYEPEVGRWTTKDPIGMSGGYNTYIYVGDNPILLLDPIGLIPLSDCIKSILRPYFPNLDLDKIQLHPFEETDFFHKLPFISGAEAWTDGNDVYLNQGYMEDIGTSEGIALIGHELTHTSQQAAAGSLSFLTNYLGTYILLQAPPNGLSAEDAYQNIPYEVDAYVMQMRILRKLKEKYGDKDPCNCP
jgi:RHS repeat-associated protein